MADAFSAGFATGQKAYESWKDRQDKEKDRKGEARERESRAGYYDAQAEQIRGDRAASEAAGAGMLSAKRAILRREGESDKDLKGRRDEYKRENPQAGTGNKEARSKAAKAAADAKLVKQQAREQAIANRFSKRANAAVTDKQLKKKARIATQESVTKLNQNRANLNKTRIENDEAALVHRNNKEFSRGQARADLTTKELEIAKQRLEIEGKKHEVRTAEDLVKSDELAEKELGVLMGEMGQVFKDAEDGDFSKYGSTVKTIEALRDKVAKLPRTTVKEKEYAAQAETHLNKMTEASAKWTRWKAKSNADTISQTIDIEVAKHGPEETAYMQALSQTNPPKYRERRIMYHMRREAEEKGMPFTIFSDPQFKGKIYENGLHPDTPYLMEDDGKGGKRYVLDGNGKPIENRVLDYAGTMSKWNAFKQKWDATYKNIHAKNIRRSKTADEQSRGGGGLDLGAGMGGEVDPTVPTSEQSDETQISSSLAQQDPIRAGQMPPQEQWDAMTPQTLENIWKQLDDPNWDATAAYTTPQGAGAHGAVPEEPEFNEGWGEMSGGFEEEMGGGGQMSPEGGKAPQSPPPADTPPPAPVEPAPAEEKADSEESYFTPKNENSLNYTLNSKGEGIYSTKHQPEFNWKKVREDGVGSDLNTIIEANHKDARKKNKNVYSSLKKQFNNSIYASNFFNHDIDYLSLIEDIDSNSKFGADWENWPDEITVPLAKSANIGRGGKDGARGFPINDSGHAIIEVSLSEADKKRLFGAIKETHKMLREDAEWNMKRKGAPK